MLARAEAVLVCQEACVFDYRLQRAECRRSKMTKGHRKYDSARRSHLLRTYGITEEQYEQLLQSQSGSCGVCKRPASVFKTRLCVDHDHSTGEIRGLLCIHCNRRVIGRHRDPALFYAAGDYLSKGTGLFVPTKRPKRRIRRRKPVLRKKK